MKFTTESMGVSVNFFSFHIPLANEGGNEEGKEEGREEKESEVWAERDGGGGGKRGLGGGKMQTGMERKGKIYIKKKEAGLEEAIFTP